MLHQNAWTKKELKALSKEQNFFERLLQMCFAKHVATSHQHQQQGGRI
jgi:hypothetical protein